MTGKNSSFSLISLLPNLVTLTSLCIALSAIQMAIHGDFFKAVAFLLIAGFMDGIDGRLARYLNSTSDFGANLDSLIDFVNFGVAPGFIIYAWVNSYQDILGLDWAMVLFFAVCASIRLARFNSDINKSSGSKILDEYFFVGIPAPVGAAMSTLPMVLTREFGEGFYSDSYLVIFYVITIALLMASKLPTISIKNIPIKNNYRYLTLIIASSIIIGLLVKPWLTLSTIGVTYGVSIPLVMLLLYQKKII